MKYSSKLVFHAIIFSELLAYVTVIPDLSRYTETFALLVAMEKIYYETGQ